MGKRGRGKLKKKKSFGDNLLGFCWGVRALLPAAEISLLHKDYSMLRSKRATSVKKHDCVDWGWPLSTAGEYRSVYNQELIVLIETTWSFSKAGRSRSNLAGLWLPRLGSGDSCSASTFWIWTSINPTCFCSQPFEAAGCFCFQLFSNLRKSFSFPGGTIAG